MSLEIIEKLSELELELSAKESAILKLTQQVQELTKSNELFRVTLNSKEYENTTLRAQITRLEEWLKEKTSNFEALLTKYSSLLSENEFLQKSKSLLVSACKPENPELNLIRMQYSDLEARYIRKEEQLVLLESRYEQQIRDFSDKSSQDLWQKRQKWLEYKPATLNFDPSFLSPSESTLPQIPTHQSCDSILQDIEKLLGWKLTYNGLTLTLSSLGKSLLIKKQEYANNTYYNIEVSSDSMQLITTLPYSAFLFKYQNYPAFFASIIFNEFSKLDLSNF